MTSLELLNYELKRSAANPQSTSEPCDRESKLRESILGYCESQWPRWKCVWARSDKKSTLPLGCQDLTIFADGGRVILVELKTKTGKQSEDQRNWAHEMSKLGFEVFIIRSFEEFMAAVNGNRNFQE